MPECVEDKVTHDTILYKFKEWYMETKDGIETYQGTILGNLIDSRAIQEAAKINAKVVEQACGRMKAWKSDVSASFTCDAILNGPKVLYELIAAIFSSYFVHSSISTLILTCALLPLFKGGFKNQEKFYS